VREDAPGRTSEARIEAPAGITGKVSLEPGIAALGEVKMRATAHHARRATSRSRASSSA
jgi:hypothetical protein